MNTKRFTGMSKGIAAAAALTLQLATGGAGRGSLQASPALAGATQQTNTEGKFYCNVKVLTPAGRAQQKLLTQKLIASRTRILEIATGYEFMFHPADVSVAELANWVTTEAKCCPFFDFHIDLEIEGTQACLRLTGDEGIKAFIQTEFQVPTK
jgi:hypothetical protein